MAATQTLERAPGRGAAPRQAARPLVPFVRAAHRHVEGAFSDVTVTPGAAATTIAPADVPSYGYLTAVWIHVLGSAGVLGTGVLNADFPFSAIQEVSLVDPNGANIQFPVTGFQLMLENAYGGYVWSSDPAATPDFDATLPTPQFALRIPVQITPWDGFGSLANQNAASAYKVRVTVAAFNPGLVTTTGTAVAPALRFRYFLEAWSPPAQTDLLGQAQETMPPGLGTTQFWSPFSPVIAAGQQTIRLTRVGNLIRNIIFVVRDNTALTVRLTANFPDSITINWDASALYSNELRTYRRRKMFEATNFQPFAGVFAYQFTDDQDGHAGYENRHLWLPTVNATRLEISGSFGAAGTLEILTNDVAVTPAGR